MGEKIINIKIGGVKIEQVKQFKYLGVIVDSNGNQEAALNERIEKAIKVYCALNNRFIYKKEISRKTKMSVYKTVYRPVLTYGCEMWVLSKSQKIKIQTAEMKYLRRVVGVTRKNRVRNTQIREYLEMKSILDFIEQRQLCRCV